MKLDRAVPDRLLRWPDVADRVSMSRDTVDRRIAAGTFPAPVNPGKGRPSLWLESKINAWLASLA